MEEEALMSVLGDQAASQAGSSIVQSILNPEDKNSAVNVNYVSTPDYKIASDENLKDKIVNEGMDPIDCMADIDAFLYKYKPGAVAMFGDEAQDPSGKTNSEENFGVMAQDLAKNPITAAAVHQDDSGYLMLDGNRLSSINTAMITEMCKRIQELEEAVYGRK